MIFVIISQFSYKFSWVNITILKKKWEKIIKKKEFKRKKVWKVKNIS
jgi:hypothetical protein